MFNIKGNLINDNNMNRKLLPSLICLLLLLTKLAEPKPLAATQTGQLDGTASPISAATTTTTLASIIHLSTTGAATKTANTTETGDDGDELDDDDNDDEEEEEDVDEDEEDDEEEEDEAEVEEDNEQLAKNSLVRAQQPQVRVVTDLFGNRIKLENNRTFLISQNKARDLGLLTFKAIILGPLIGLSLKSALIKGLIWSLLAYGLHLFFPALLSALGLGTGLVGFGRQMQPDYAQMLFPQLARLPANIQTSLPGSVQRLLRQYRQRFQPVIETIRTIPDGHCRYRAVCETASNLIRSSRFMSNTLQRLSATVYLNFGTEYSKAWLDGVVQSDCAARYNQCASSPFSTVSSQLAEALRQQ